jgi:hypothetical protein
LINFEVGKANVKLGKLGFEPPTLRAEI